MRVKATIKTSLKGILSQWKQVVLMFAIFPLILSFFFGSAQKDSFKPDINRDRINIEIEDRDNSELSKTFIDLFKTKGLKEIFNVTEEGNYIITIPKNYENDIRTLKETTIEVEEKERVSMANELIINNVIKEYGKKLTENRIILNRINTLNIEDKETLFSEVTNNIDNNLSTTSLRENIIKGERVLTAFESKAANMMALMIFTIIMGCIAGHDLDKKNGTNKRLMSTPMTKLNFFNLDLVVFFIASFIYGLVYILAFRVTGLAFKEINPLNIILILITQSLLVTTISGAIIAYFGKKIANGVVMALMYVEIICGGTFIPLKDISNNVLLTISKYSPGNIISRVYTNGILFNSFEAIRKYLIIMILTSIILYLISIIKVKIRWEVQ